MKQKKISEIFEKLISSFDVSKKGFSARKLSAFTVVVLVVVVHLKWIKSDRWEYLAEILALDYMFVLSLFGLTTWQGNKEKENQE